MKARKRLRLQERLGYAHTLAGELAARAIELQERCYNVAGRNTPCGRRLVPQFQEAWRRYDRVTRFLYENTQV